MATGDYYEQMRLLGLGPRGESIGPPPEPAETAARFEELVATWVEAPALATGYRRAGRAKRWVRRLSDGTCTLIAVQRHSSSSSAGWAEFTVEWAIWTPSFARRVSNAKRLQPSSNTAEFAGRVPNWFDPPDDVWWTVRGQRVVEDPSVSRSGGEITWPPTADDDVPRTLSELVLPFLADVIDQQSAGHAIEVALERGLWRSVTHIDLSSEGEGPRPGTAFPDIVDMPNAGRDDDPDVAPAS